MKIVRILRCLLITAAVTSHRLNLRYSADAAYMNSMLEEGEIRIRAAADGPNYDRLCKIKGTYDPGNFFHVNQNIASGGRSAHRVAPGNRLNDTAL